MKNLTFITGTMGSAKTLDLLATRYEYTSKPGSGYEVVLVAPEKDTRRGLGVVHSRAGLQASADIILPCDSRVQDHYKFADFGLYLFLVDEAQFMSKKNIESFRQLVDDDRFDAKVIAYGLRTDYLGNLFEGSQRLLELADDIQVRHSICSYCEKYATFNLRLGNLDGGQLVLGDDYAPVCSTCYVAENGDFCDD